MRKSEEKKTLLHDYKFIIFINKNNFTISYTVRSLIVKIKKD